MQENKQRNLQRQMVKGAFWSYGETVFNQAVSLIVSILLARMLEPETFGVLAIVMVFINLCNTLSITGFGNALIQKSFPEEKDYSTVLLFSLFLSVVMCVVLWLGAPAVAHFYKNEQLIWVLRIMSFRIPISAINSIQNAYVQKKMDFHKLFIATFGGTTISAVIGIVMAYKGFGVWALVAQYMSASCITTFMMFYITKWKPSLYFSLKRLKPLYSYGWKIMLAGLATSLTNELRTLIVGKKFTTADLAYYERGQRYPQMIASNLAIALAKVSFPAFSNVNRDSDQMKQIIRKSNQICIYVLVPLMVGLALIAKSLIILLMTEKWAEAVPYIQIFSVYYLLYAMASTSWQVLKATGRSKEYMFLSVIESIIEISLLCIAVFIFKSVKLIAIGAVISMLTYVLYGMYAMKKFARYSLREQLKDCLTPCAYAFLMALVVILIEIGSKFSVFVTMVIQVIAGMIIYFGVSWLVRDRTLMALVRFLQDIFSKKG